MNGIEILGWGSALPDGVITTADLAERFGVDESWILDRTGMEERRTGMSTNSLAVAAAANALDSTPGVDPESISKIIVATCSPSQAIPSTAAFVQRSLHLPDTAAAFDLNAACSGFVYGLVVSAGLSAIDGGNTLLIGAETMTAITDYEDRDTAILFGDGAGAAIIGPAVETDLVAFDLRNDPSGFDALTCATGGVMEMDGPEVFNLAVTSIVDTVTATLEKARIEVSDVDVFVPHHANLRLIASAWRLLGIDMGKTALTISGTGNTSAASIPVAMSDAVAHGRVASGDMVLLVGFGAGMSAGSALYRHRG